MSIRTEPPSSIPNNQDVFVWALYLLGGADQDVDVEAIYLKCFELAPARLAWRTRPDLPDYKKISTSLTNETFNVGWSSLMDFNQAFDDETDRKQLLTAVKESLNHGDRLTFGVLLFSPQMGMAGAVGKHTASNDTWIITPAIDDMINIHDVHGGHEMIITGYDDNAIATDENGQLYKGLLTLRNSWGKYAGDAGNFYMSYDYFTRLTVEVQRIRRLY